MTTVKPYRVLLYYMYAPIENPEEFAAQHLEFCKELGLKGRILVAEEGINGTVSGTIEQTDEYMQAMQKKILVLQKWCLKWMKQMDMHLKMHVRPREELVTLRLEDDVNPNELTGKYLSPKEFF
ncbi:hypothetical protein GCM10020331_065130 [Ectobacillus funiculus]